MTTRTPSKQGWGQWLGLQDEQARAEARAKREEEKRAAEDKVRDGWAELTVQLQPGERGSAPRFRAALRCAPPDAAAPTLLSRRPT